MQEKAKTLMFDAWCKTLPSIRKENPDYGYGENPYSLWDKLPDVSKEHWLNRVDRINEYLKFGYSEEMIMKNFII